MHEAGIKPGLVREVYTMQIKITRAFKAPDSPRPFLPQELVTVPDEIANKWIAEGNAIPYSQSFPQPTPPPKAKRERATR